MKTGCVPEIMDILRLKEILAVTKRHPAFLTSHSEEEAMEVESAFDELTAWFCALHEEKFDWPQEFRESLTAHKRNDPRVMETLSDVRNRYLIMAEFYDFARLTKIIQE